jgi:hypothetical protein
MDPASSHLLTPFGRSFWLSREGTWAGIQILAWVHMTISGIRHRS